MSKVHYAGEGASIEWRPWWMKSWRCEICQRVTEYLPGDPEPSSLEKIKSDHLWEYQYCSMWCERCGNAGILHVSVVQDDSGAWIEEPSPVGPPVFPQERGNQFAGKRLEGTLTAYIKEPPKRYAREDSQPVGPPLEKGRRQPWDSGIVQSAMTIDPLEPVEEGLATRMAEEKMRKEPETDPLTMLAFKWGLIYLSVVLVIIAIVMKVTT